jgi:hypothetical protein
MGSGHSRVGMGGKIAIAVLGIAVVLNFWLLHRIDDRLSRMDIRSHVRTAIANVYGPNQFDTISGLCPQSETASPVCAALADHSYRNLGVHNDLWVSLDAMLQVSKAKLDPEQRRRMQWLFADLSSAISTGGAWAYEQAPGGDTDILAATDLYWPIIAQAVACNSVPDLGCAGRLPADVSAALDKLAAFVLDVGPTVALYDMSFRIDAIRNLTKSGLL